MLGYCLAHAYLRLSLHSLNWSAEPWGGQEDEMKGCTFTPVITKTPSYIKPERVAAARVGVRRNNYVPERQWL